MRPAKLLAYFAALLDRRAAESADDFMTALAARRAAGQDRQDVIANCIFFINAGHQTTTTLLTLGTHLLCTHPEAGGGPAATIARSGRRRSRKCSG